MPKPPALLPGVSILLLALLGETLVATKFPSASIAPVITTWEPSVIPLGSAPS
jgi:hypothetical protein